MYGLTSQLRRASVSIQANIAEGCGRTGDAELARFLHSAVGSASETGSLLLIAIDLGFLREDNSIRLSSEGVEVKKMPAGFIRDL